MEDSKGMQYPFKIMNLPGSEVGDKISANDWSNNNDYGSSKVLHTQDKDAQLEGDVKISDDVLSLENLGNDASDELSISIVNKMINTKCGQSDCVEDPSIGLGRSDVMLTHQVTKDTGNQYIKDKQSPGVSKVVGSIEPCIQAEETNNNALPSQTKQAPLNGDTLVNKKNSPKSQQRRKPKKASLDEFLFRCIHCEGTFSDLENYRTHLAGHSQASPNKGSPKSCKKGASPKTGGNAVQLQNATGKAPLLNGFEGNVVAKQLMSTPMPVIASALTPNQYMSTPSLPQRTHVGSAKSPQQQSDKRKESHYKCRVCLKTFSFPCNLKQHFKLHSNADPFSCDCGMLFSSAAAFDKHHKSCNENNTLRGAAVTDTVTPVQKVTPIVIKPRGNTKKGAVKFCIVCGHFCSGQAALDEHMKNHADENLLNCEKCGKHFLTSHDLFQHLNTHFKGTGNSLKNGTTKDLFHAKRPEIDVNANSTNLNIAPVYNCDICDLSFKESAGLSEHINEVHINRPIKEEEVDPHIESGSTGDNHMTTQAKSCDSHDTMEDMSAHISTHYNNKDLQVKCSKLDGALTNPSIKQEPSEYLCPYCPCSYRTEDELLKHVQQDRCSSAYQQSISLNNSPDGSFQTEQFTALAGSPAKGKRSPRNKLTAIRKKKKVENTAKSPDLDDITVLSESRRYKCDICDASFMHIQELKVHKQEHKGNKCYECKVCGKRFVKSSAMFYHAKIHTGEEPYKCQFCGKTFRSSSNLKAHENLHTGLKMFKCKECGKEFRSNSNLRTHMKFHSTEKPFQCVFCEKAFAVRYNLKVHLRTHSGDKYYKCSCGKGYTSNDSLKRHMVKCHGVKQDEVTA